MLILRGCNLGSPYADRREIHVYVDNVAPILPDGAGYLFSGVAPAVEVPDARLTTMPKLYSSLQSVFYSTSDIAIIIKSNVIAAVTANYVIAIYRGNGKIVRIGIYSRNSKRAIVLNKDIEGFDALAKIALSVVMARLEELLHLISPEVALNPEKLMLYAGRSGKSLGRGAVLYFYSSPFSLLSQY